MFFQNEALKEERLRCSEICEKERFTRKQKLSKLLRNSQILNNRGFSMD